MPLSPITLTFYTPDDSVEREFTRTRLPWGLLKEAIALSKDLDGKNAGAEELDRIAQFVVKVFGGQFTVADLNEKVEIGEMLAVIQSVAARTAAIMQANPTARPSSKKKR